MSGAPVFISAVILVTFLLMLLVKRGGHWLLNVAVIATTFTFCFFVWNALNSYSGWPVRASVPQNSIFIGAVIDEPSQVEGDPGHIDLWLVPATSSTKLLGYKPAQGEPRAYRLPYSVPLEKAVLNAQRLQRGSHGQPVALSVSKRIWKHNHGKALGTKIPKKEYRAYRLPPFGQQLKGN